MRQYTVASNKQKEVSNGSTSILQLLKKLLKVADNRERAVDPLPGELKEGNERL